MAVTHGPLDVLAAKWQVEMESMRRRGALVLGAALIEEFLHDLDAAARTEASEALNLEEINSPGNDVNPSLTKDGLNIVWQSPNGEETFIYESSRSTPEALFAERKKMKILTRKPQRLKLIFS